jgi:hypothetical protein
MEIKIKELKEKIVNKTIGDNLLVFIYLENSFLANQYIDETVAIKNKEKVYIETIEQIPTNTFGIESKYFYVINTEKFDSNITNFYGYKNVAIVCKLMSERVRPHIVSTARHVKLPKLQDWQIIDYMKSKLPLIPETQVKWLYNMYSGDIYRINSELLKLSLFDDKKQLEMFKLMFDEGIYKDLGSIDRFSLCNSILQKDTRAVLKILSAKNEVEVEPMTLVSLLTENIKHIIRVNLDKDSTYKSLNMTEKHYNVITDNYKHLKSKNLLKMFDFITSIDYKLKSGLLQMSDDRLVDYIIINMLNFMVSA